MKTRRLGRSELRVSVVGVGTWQFGGEWGHAFTQPEVDDILDTACACGINLIDTAECYGDHLSEQLIGNYLSRRDRSKWIVATKFGHRFHGFLDRTYELDPDGVRAQLEASLRALRLDAVDLYQFHSVSDEAFENSALWDMLIEAKKAGKIRHIGVSISSPANERQAAGAGPRGAVALQVVYNRLQRDAEAHIVPSATRDDLGLLARVPLASGLLAGRYTKGHRFTGTDVRARWTPEDTDARLIEAEKVLQEEVPKGVNPAAWAIAWCLREEKVSCVIPGCKSPEQVRINASASALLT